MRTKILYIQGKPKEASACLSYLLELHTSYSDSQKTGLFSVYIRCNEKTSVRDNLLFYTTVTHRTLAIQHSRVPDKFGGF